MDRHKSQTGKGIGVSSLSYGYSDLDKNSFFSPLDLALLSTVVLLSLIGSVLIVVGTVAPSAPAPGTGPRLVG